MTEFCDLANNYSQLFMTRGDVGETALL